MSEVQFAQKVPKLQRHQGIRIPAIEHKLPEPESRGPYKGECDRVADRSAEGRGDDIALDTPRNDRRDDEMTAYEGQERRKYPRGHARSDRVRRSSQA